MRPSVLCYQRLQRLLRVLNRHGGSASIRDLQRSHGIWRWEVEQAQEQGWVRIFSKKPAVGRPSDFAEKVNNSPFAKYPPNRRLIERWINWRHRAFAEYSVRPVNASNLWGFRMPSKTMAYMMAYRSCRSKAAAAVGASRLMKRMDVRLMRRWLFCHFEKQVTGNMPLTRTELIEQLEPLGYIIRRQR